MVEFMMNKKYYSKQITAKVMPDIYDEVLKIIENTDQNISEYIRALIIQDIKKRYILQKSR